jgi:hypothetical protein
MLSLSKHEESEKESGNQPDSLALTTLTTSLHYNHQ